ncbi:TPA: hypothetical protein MYO72_005468 [Citrobacter freundii]|uniref:hypothetical protein n=1 Tax=unclassified Citrobacter freundii complex TaxID=2816438 RepID=UPI000CDCCAE6|nr:MULTISPECIES: hypothetical protein [unclassified Citrobacter freundii complex]HCB1469554.1 hypothetical protein [Citrobacter freundii]AUZ69697.1 hypothetical protein C2U41_10230 [Citrobacter freundii complex sp. CFNIH4]POU05769.1 hypothetical protein C3368_26205 [Citrobacter freundii complex sp. CFNIH7]POU08079.1 hypothetical protein C3381_26175 [Citrobacter freundii complex sp. CFNIH6]HCB1508749.1 hypothetical protein [Citrobacter freundii]
MNDREFQRFLEESKRRNRHNSYSYTTTPTSYELPKFTKKERKGIDEVIRAITPRNRYMPTRKSTKNTIKTYLANFDSYEQLPSKLDDIFIGFCRSEGHPKYNKKLFYLLKNLDDINSSTVTNHLQRQATRLSYELPTDAYCALLVVMCAKLIGIVEHHIAVGNIEPMENEQPDFEFDVYAQAEGF